MKNRYITIYTKEYGKQELTKEDWYDYDIGVVTFHRLGGPARKWADGSKEWRSNGVLHREDGPAVESVEGFRFWWFKGKLHRSDGPAVERAGGTEAWFINGKLHRSDGPAKGFADGTKAWYLDDVEYTEKKFKAVINKYKQLPKQMKQTHKLWWVREL